MFSWSRCIICQKSTSEELRCPLGASGDRADPKAVYTSFLCSVFEFNALEPLPIPVSMPLDIDAEVLIENEASWHKSCHLQFSTSKLNKAKERSARKLEQAQKEDEEMQASKTRRLSSQNKEDCILCGQGGQRHEVSTFATDEKLRLMITELQDSTFYLEFLELISWQPKQNITSNA